jgi:TPR repeat protein
MPPTDEDRMTADSLAAAYWEAVVRQRNKVDTISIEESPPRHRGPDFQVTMWRLVDQLLESSKSGSLDAWCMIGDAYQTGTGTKRNREQALRWFRKAADSGHIRSMVRLGIALHHPDYEETWAESVTWFQKAADLGDAKGMVFLGFAYREGQGVAQDYELAAGWFIKAVAAGDTGSMIHAGGVLARHLNSHAEALGWFLRAAEHGNKDGFLELAMLYDQPGTPVHNPAEAVKWYKVVEQKTMAFRPRAMMALAIHCRDGDGTPRDLKAAAEWLRQYMQLTREKSKEHRAAAKMLKCIIEDTESC